MLHELNRVIDYIEAHLTDDLSLEAISNYAGVPDHHFRKIFFYLSGMTLSEYIKTRRLSEAGKALMRGETVTQAALGYGYESIDGFTRAFKKWCGVLPSDVGKKGVSKSFSKFTFVAAVKGGVVLDFRIEEKPAFTLAGVSRRVPLQFEGVNDEIVKLAMSITDEQKEEMHALQNMAPYEIVNASWDSDVDFLKEEGDLTHLIGVLTTKTPARDLLDTVAVAACTWAIFPNEGPFPATLQATMAKIYAEWLPASDYQILNAPSFSFTKMDSHRQAYAYSEVWVPVQKR